MTTSFLRFRTRVLSNKRSQASSFLLFAPQLSFTSVLSLSWPSLLPNWVFPTPISRRGFSPLPLLGLSRDDFEPHYLAARQASTFSFPEVFSHSSSGLDFRSPGINKSKESPPHPKHSDWRMVKTFLNSPFHASVCPTSSEVS